MVLLTKMDIWLQTYDIPKGLVTKGVIRSIRDYVGTFVKSDPANNEWNVKAIVRLCVTIDVQKSVKRRMKV